MTTMRLISILLLAFAVTWPVMAAPADHLRGREVTSAEFFAAQLAGLQVGPTTRPAPATQPATRPAGGEPNPPAEGFDLEGSDPKAVALADKAMEKMGGRRAWDQTRYLTWNFFGHRRHVWDRRTSSLRVEGANRETGETFVILMSLATREGRAFKGGKAVTDPEELARMLDAGEAMWINDSYWLLMPYKLKDTGVTLRYVGPMNMETRRPADVLELTFKDVGRTPQNKYHVFVAKSSGLVEQWDYFADASDESPKFKVPWRNWRRYGRILLSDDRGELGGRPARLTGIAVFDELPDSIFTSPDPIDWEKLIEGASR